MNRRIRNAIGLAGLLLLAGAIVGHGQEAILALSLDPTEIAIPQGGEAVAVLRIENTSVRVADDIEPSLDAEGLVLHAEPESIEVLDPFDSGTIVLRLSASETAALGVSEQVLEILYTYCIGDLCFQLLEEIPLILTVEPPSVAPIEVPMPSSPGATEPASPFWFRLGGLALGIALIAAAIVIRRVFGVRWPVYAALIAFIVGSLAYGVVLNQHEQAQGIGAVLCTSCVGIEETRREDPEITPAGIEALEGLSEEIELIVFYAEWCHTCPFAKAMVEEMAVHSAYLTYRFVDVEEDPERARESGIVRSGRTVVPAVLRVDTGEVVFGVENLETRLIDLLEADA